VPKRGVAWRASSRTSARPRERAEADDHAELFEQLYLAAREWQAAVALAGNGRLAGGAQRTAAVT